MRRAFFALGGTALTLTAVDLAHKATVEATYVHPRSAVYAAVVLGLAALWSALILATRSALIALAGGVVLGGALGNLVSLALWPGIPNPIALEPIAFNLADAFVLLGFATTAAAALVFALGNRERLSEPIRLR